MRYDIIGDIHGNLHDLLALLKKMGYSLSNKGHYYHPERQAVFVGDYIDRGKNSKEVVQLVRAMQENGSAIALMGNHEYNAICFHTKGSTGGYLRPRTNQNIKQHCASLQSFRDDETLNEAIEWFKKLPLFYENEYFRVVHACWDQEHLDVLATINGSNFLKSEFLEYSATDGTALFKALEIVLKGHEINLPNGISFLDKDGYKRTQIRVKWWEDPVGKSYKDICVKMEEGYNNLTDSVPPDKAVYPVYGKEEKPVFFGHYWLEDEIPMLQTPNVCCLDYSVANNGKLVAYRFNGEHRLNDKNYVYA
jgi:hypothetical protein